MDIRSAAEQARVALTELRDVCKANPSMQGREFVGLGIQVNNALAPLEAALQTKPVEAAQTSDMVALLSDPNFRMTGGSEFALEIITALSSAPPAAATVPPQQPKPDPKNCTAKVVGVPSGPSYAFRTQSCTTGRPLIDKGGSSDGERDYYECPDCGKSITIDWREN